MLRHALSRPGSVVAAFAAALAISTAAGSAFAHEPSAPTSTQPGTAVPVLWDNLGTLHYPITTSSALAQKYFDQGLRLAYAFNHAEARRAFHYAQELDPACALCYWGEALVIGPNINAAMAPEAVAPAVAAVAKAKAIGNASAKEKALIAALATRYSDSPDADRSALDAAYAEAMVKVAAGYPDDLDIVVLAAEALMDVQPWDYWDGEAGSKTPKGSTTTILAMLERVLKANPDHPGAIHYYIHMTEASDTPEVAEPYADRLPALMPGAGHLVHMGSHTYYRVGRYVDSRDVNIAAVKADEAFLAEVNDTGLYGGGLYPHNVHFILTSSQMAGDAETTIATAQKLAGVVADEAAATIPWVQPIKAAPYFAHAQYDTPETILALADPGDVFPYVRGSWHYARGVAFAALGDVESAAGEAAAIEAIEKTADLGFLVDNYVPADVLLQIARHVVLARIAQTEGDAEGAIAEFEAAVKLQDGIFYMEPPYWYYPVRQSLGAALLLAGEAEEAVAVFEESLEQAPKNGWALFGLKEAQKKLGDTDGARATEAAFEEAWVGSADFLDLSKL